MISLGAEGTSFEFDDRAGTYSVNVRDGTLFRGAFGRLIWADGGGPGDVTTAGGWERVPASETGVFLQRAEDWGRLLFEARVEGGALLLRLGLAWDASEEPPGLDSVIPLHVPPGGVWPGRESAGSWRFYVHGWQCWTPSGVIKRSRPGDYLFPAFMPGVLKPMLANTATPVDCERGVFYSEWFGALGDLQREDSALVGFTGVGRALSQVSARLPRNPGGCSLEAACRFEGKRPGRREEFWSEPLAVIPGDLSGRNFEAYAQMVAREQGVRGIKRSAPGWCSWYHYFTGVGADDVKSNLELISGRHRDLGIGLVQVDDGYQASLGEWLETNEDFPGGMEEIARAVEGEGLTPGIWLAPFTVTRRSRLFRDKREWVISDRRGRPVLAGVNPMWKGRYYGLDPSHPGVLEWLRGLFGEVVRRGYRFIKLDFLACGMLEGERYDPSLTRAEALRRALEVIREAVGPDTYLLGAGGPILLVAGVFDAQRVGGDVAPYWRLPYQRLIRDRCTPGTRNCLIYMFTRAFMHGRLFEGDPDCLLLRGSATRMTLHERRTLASGIAVFGGSFMLSDDLSLWGPEEEDTAALLLPHVHASPRCPDLWKREIPMYLVSSLEEPGGRYHLVWAVNWAGAERSFEVRPAELGLEPARYHAHEFWTGSYLGEVTDAFTLRPLPNHGSAVVKLTPAGGGPRLVGSNIHISQGAAELRAMDVSSGGARLAFTCVGRRDAVVRVALPGVREVSAGDGGGGGVSLAREGGDVYRLEFELDCSREVDLHWTGG